MLSAQLVTSTAKHYLVRNSPSQIILPLEEVIYFHKVHKKPVKVEVYILAYITLPISFLK